jgi:GTP cyclohydrolase I
MTLIKETEKQKYCEERRKAIKEEYAYPKMISFENKTKYNGFVIVKDIDFSTNCEHHLVSIKGKCHIGYIPNQRLIGLSQVARVVEWFCNPTTQITQEEANQQIIEFIAKDSEPLGIIVIIEAYHDCMNSRGVKQRNAYTITSEVRGLFYHENIKNEFFQLIGLQK